MPLQNGKNVVVSYKAETVFNTPPGVVTGANRFRPNASPGMSFKRATIAPNEIRSDLKTSMARLGFGEAAGSYAADFSVGTFDPLLEAITRGTWSSPLTITAVTMTSLTTGVNTIIATSGSWLTQGIRVGDVIRATGFLDASNNQRNLRVVGVTASTITVAETLVANATASTVPVITRQKKVFQPTVPVRRSFTIDEFHADIGQSEQYTGCRVSSLKIAGQPNGMCTADFGFVGAGVNPLSQGSSPFFTSPVLSGSIGLVLADATIRYAGADVATLTAFDLMLDNRASTQPSIGSTTTSDVFDNTASLSGTMSMQRKDLTNISKFTGETEFEMQLLLVEPMAEPKNFLSIFISRMKLGGVDAPFGSDGAMIESLPWMAGDKEVVTGYEDTMIMFATSAP
jgi:hypothetical protein